MGRPVSPVPEAKGDELIAWIAEGKTVREWCRIPGNPCYATVYDWKDKDPSFNTRFAYAREVGEEVLSQECLAIADTPQSGQVVTEKPDGSTEIKTGDMIEHRKLRIETRLKLLAKWNPSKYGDRTNVNHSGTVTLGSLVTGSWPKNE